MRANRCYVTDMFAFRPLVNKVPRSLGKGPYPRRLSSRSPDAIRTIFQVKAPSTTGEKVTGGGWRRPLGLRPPLRYI